MEKTLSFRVGVTSDILDSRGEPAFGREPLQALDPLKWEWLPRGLREITAEHAATYDALPSTDQTPHPHGTGMAGAIGSHQRLLGVAPGARILGIRAFGVDAHRQPGLLQDDEDSDPLGPPFRQP